MRIAYVSHFDHSKVENQSGTAYHIPRALREQSMTVLHIGPLRERYGLLLKGKQYLSNRLMGKLFGSPRYRRDREPLVLRGYARQLVEQLPSSVDLVFSPSTIPVAYLECDQPIVFWTDATFAGMLNFYPNFSHLSRQTIASGHEVENSALKHCNMAIYSSDWAAQTAIESYDVDPAKVKVVPFGANIEVKCDRTLWDIERLVRSRSFSKCKLLFLGVDWARKGGDVALEVTEQLNKQGLATELTVVGCYPDVREPLPGSVEPLGFISKRTRDGLNRIRRLIAESHFLILPARAECFGIALCEANAFGVPCLATSVGGIPTVVKDGVNGKLFSKDACAAEYCHYIVSVLANRSEYTALALSSFNEYQQRLNWTVAAQQVRSELSKLVPQGGGQ